MLVDVYDEALMTPKYQSIPFPLCEYAALPPCACAKEPYLRIDFISVYP